MTRDDIRTLGLAVPEAQIDAAVQALRKAWGLSAAL